MHLWIAIAAGVPLADERHRAEAAGLLYRALDGAELFSDGEFQRMVYAIGELLAEGRCVRIRRTGDSISIDVVKVF